MKRKFVPFIALSALMLIGCNTNTSSSSSTPTSTKDSSSEKASETSSSAKPSETSSSSQSASSSSSSSSTPISSSSSSSSSQESSSSEVVVTPDLALDLGNMVNSEDGNTQSDGKFTVYKKDKTKDGVDAKLSQIKLSGNTEFKSTGVVKAIGFTAAKSGTIRLEWKSGNKAEKTRVGFVFQANSDGSLKQTIGRQIMEVSDQDPYEALWCESEFNLPAAGTYYIGANAAISVRVIEVFYDETVTTVTPFDEVGTNKDLLDPIYSLPTSNDGYTTEKTIGNYKLGVGVQSKFYGKIENDEVTGSKIQYYSCFEFADQEAMKFTASATGTLVMLIAGRSAAVTEGETKTYPKSSFICKNAAGTEVTATGDANKEIDSNETGTKKIHKVSFTLAAGTYTFTSTNVTDLYYSSFSAIE